MKQSILFLFVISIFIYSCENDHGTWKNLEIDQKIKDEIKAQNIKLFQAVIDSNPAALKSLMSDTLLLTGVNIDSFISELRPYFKVAENRPLDEFYHKDLKKDNKVIVSSGQDDNRYSIAFGHFNPESYASVFLASAERYDLLVITVYGRYENEWKLNIVTVGMYGALGRNAEDYYNAAIKYLQKSYLFDAMMNITLAELFLKPGFDHFRYHNHEQIQEAYENIRKEFIRHYDIDLIFDSIPQKPQLLNIYPTARIDGMMPSFHYRTNIPLKDSAAIKKEYELVRKHVMKTLYGIDVKRRYIEYKVYADNPKDTASEAHYTFLDDLSKDPDKVIKAYPNYKKKK